MKKSKTSCDLKRCLMCRLCTKEWIPAIAANREMFRLKKGDNIFREGEMVNGIYFIYEGTVKVHKKWDNEKELILRFARNGDIAGHRGLGSDLIYPVTATALEDITMCFINLEFFYASLRVNYEFVFQLMMFYASELKESEKNMRNLAHMPVKGRVAHALLTLSDRFGTKINGCIDFTLSRQDLASYAGTTYETTFRILNELAREDIIKLQSKDIMILSKASLQELSTSI